MIKRIRWVKNKEKTANPRPGGGGSWSTWEGPHTGRQAEGKGPHWHREPHATCEGQHGMQAVRTLRSTRIQPLSPEEGMSQNAPWQRSSSTCVYTHGYKRPWTLTYSAWEFKGVEIFKVRWCPEVFTLMWCSFLKALCMIRLLCRCVRKM